MIGNRQSHSSPMSLAITPLDKLISQGGTRITKAAVSVVHYSSSSNRRAVTCRKLGSMPTSIAAWLTIIEYHLLSRGLKAEPYFFTCFASTGNRFSASLGGQEREEGMGPASRVCEAVRQSRCRQNRSRDCFQGWRDPTAWWRQPQCAALAAHNSSRRRHNRSHLRYA